MKVNLNPEELDLVINALNFVAECSDYDLEDSEDNESWLKPWLKELGEKSVKAEKLLDSLAEHMGVK
jgi:hypothetical protein